MSIWSELYIRCVINAYLVRFDNNKYTEERKKINLSNCNIVCNRNDGRERPGEIKLIYSLLHITT